MSNIVNIEDVPKKPGLKIAHQLMDQQVLGPEGGTHAITGAERTYIIVQTYEPGGSHDAHAHDDSEQAFLVLSGEGQMHIGGNVYPIKKGSVAYAPPNVEHSTENTGSEPLVMMLIGVRIS
jgi:quercetin dioxygenase-like cupin family protein